METTVKHANHFKCPTCGHRMNASTPANNQPALPQDNDLGICIQCGTVLQYHMEGTRIIIDKVTYKEMQEIAKEDPEAYRSVIRMQHMIRSSLND